jgi:elongation factor Ts
MLEKIKKLRARTNAGIGDCQKALAESGGDMELAVEWLRRKNIAKASSKTDRLSLEGLVGVRLARGKDFSHGIIVEMNSETDFVSRNENFQKLMQDVLNIAQNSQVQDLDRLLDSKDSQNQTTKDIVLNSGGKLGENIVIRRFKSLRVEKGVVVSYTHRTVPLEKNDFSDHLGQVGVLVALESEADQEALQEIGKKISNAYCFW